MINFLHSYHPNAILLTLGPIKIYWYGLFIVLGILAALMVIFKLAGYYSIAKETIIDLTFSLVLAGVVGARLYHLGLAWRFYLNQPAAMIKIWQGGLVIHGAIIAGLITAWYFSRKRGLNFWLTAAVLAPGLALAQAIGRWGNYFNQELFGRPTDLPWGIPIDLSNRPLEYLNSQYFQPAFLYESIGNLLIFFGLLAMHSWIIRHKKFSNFSYFLLSASYLIAYSLLRFLLEFSRIDPTPAIFGLRWPQIISLLIIFASIILLLLPRLKNRAMLKQ